MSSTAVSTAIRPCIAFSERCEEALNLYVSIFPNSKIVSLVKSERDLGPIKKGQVLNATFQLDGREYTAFDGGPTFSFTEGFSLMVMCDSQAEIDGYWSKLIAGGGEEGPCGWLKDRFGLSWQVVPTNMDDMLDDPSSPGYVRAMTAMFGMQKLDIETLQRAFDGR